MDTDKLRAHLVDLGLLHGNNRARHLLVLDEQGGLAEEVVGLELADNVELAIGLDNFES